MNRIILISIFITALVFLTACRKKSELVETEAKIIGFDMRLCACCGGWWLDIQGDTLRAMNLPGNFASQIDQNTLPLPVLISWDRENLSPCLQEELVHIKTIRKP